MLKHIIFVLSGIATFILFNMGMDYVDTLGASGWHPSWCIPASFVTLSTYVWLYFKEKQRKRHAAGEYRAQCDTNT